MELLEPMEPLVGRAPSLQKKIAHTKVLLSKSYEIWARKALLFQVNRMVMMIQRKIRLRSLPRVEGYQITGCTLPLMQKGRSRLRTACTISLIAMPTTAPSIVEWAANTVYITRAPSVKQRALWLRPTTMSTLWVMRTRPWSSRWVRPQSESRTSETRKHRLRTLGRRMDCLNFQVLLLD